MNIDRKWGNTDDMADLAGVKATTVRHNVAVRGHYLGVKPKKMPNGRFRWDLVEAAKTIGLGG